MLYVNTVRGQTQLQFADAVQFFAHERGRYMAIYALALGYSNGIAPIITGFINTGQGWRWVFVSCHYRTEFHRSIDHI